MKIDVPDIETELDLSVIEDNFDSEYATSIFSIIFGHSWVLSIISISLTVSIIGVILHGKKT